MARDDAPPPPWPGLRSAWWVYALVVVVIGLYSLGLVLRVRCLLGHCGGPIPRMLDLDAIGGLPRLLTVGFFVVTAVLAWRARQASEDRTRTWWTAVALIGLGLAVAKLVSVHSLAKAATPGLTLAASVAIAVAVLVALRVTGHRWAIAATGPVVLTLALYAATSIGLDALTTLATVSQARAGALSEAAAVFAEELGESLSALVLLVTVRWQTARARSQVARRQ